MAHAQTPESQRMVARYRRQLRFDRQQPPVRPFRAGDPLPQHLRSNHHQRQPAGSLQYRIQPEARTQHQLGGRLFIQFHTLLATAETRQHPPDLLQQHHQKRHRYYRKQKPDPIRQETNQRHRAAKPYRQRQMVCLVRRKLPLKAAYLRQIDRLQLRRL